MLSFFALRRVQNNMASREEAADWFQTCFHVFLSSWRHFKDVGCFVKSVRSVSSEGSVRATVTRPGGSVAAAARWARHHHDGGGGAPSRPPGARHPGELLHAAGDAVVRPGQGLRGEGEGPEPRRRAHVERAASGSGSPVRRGEGLPPHDVPGAEDR